MVPTLTSLQAIVAISVGNHFLTHASLVSTPPKDAVGAEALAAAFSVLETRARAAQDVLISWNAVVTQALVRRRARVKAVRLVEKGLDSTFAAICDRLLVEVKEGKDGAPEL